MSLFVIPTTQTVVPPVDRSGGFPMPKTVIIYVDKQDLLGDQNSLANFVKSKEGMVAVCGRPSEPTIRVLATMFNMCNTPFICHKNFFKKKKPKKDESDEVDNPNTVEDEAVEENEEEDENRSDVYKAKQVDNVNFEVPQNRCDAVAEPIYGEDEEETRHVHAWLAYMDRLAKNPTRAGPTVARPKSPADEFAEYKEWLKNDEDTYTTDEEREHRPHRLEAAEKKRGVPFRKTDPSDRVRGWRFWFMLNDKDLSWDRGVLNSCLWNRKHKKSLMFWEWMFTQKQWIQDGVSPYASYEFSKDDDPDRSRYAQLLPLYDEENPAQMHKVFTFARSVQMMRRGGGVSAVQCCQDLYAPHGLLKTFPRGARVIPRSVRDPRVLLTADLECPLYIDEKSLNPSEIERMMMMFAHKDRTVNVDEMTKVLTDSFERDIGGSHTKRQTSEIVDRFANWLSGAHVPPGISAAWHHLKSKIGKPIVPDETMCFDNTLSEFGNMIVVFMTLFHEVFNTATLHSELMFELINSCGAFRNKRGLRLHMLKVGPPGTGKSFLQDLMKRLMVSGTFDNVSYQTKRANTTNTSKDCMVQFSDEAPEMLTDKGNDGAGPSELKEIMSNGVTTTEQCIVDELTRERITLKTIARRLVQLNINSNASLSKMVESLIDRFFTRLIPGRFSDASDPWLQNIAKEETEVEKYWIERIQTLLSVVAILTHGIDVKWLMEPELDYATSSLIPKFFENLSAVRPGVRTRERVPLYIRPTVIFYAAYMVFGTTKHFAPGTPFELKHLVECERYFRASREIACFGISHMHDAFVDPYVHVVCTAIKSICDRQKNTKGEKMEHPPIDLSSLLKREAEIQKNFPSVAPMYTQDEIDGWEKELVEKKSTGRISDRRMYLVSTPNVGLDKMYLKNEAAGIIAAEIGSTTDVKFSKEMVYDILNWMERQAADKYGIPICSVNTSGKYYDFGVCVSRDFADAEKTNAVRNALEKTLDKHVEPGTRFVLGMTYRDGLMNTDMVEVVSGNNETYRAKLKGTETILDEKEAKRMFPHVLQVMQATSTQETHRVRNPAYKTSMFRTLIPTKLKDSIKTPDTPFVELDVDCDSEMHKHHLQILGLTEIESKTQLVRTKDAVFPLKATLADVVRAGDAWKDENGEYIVRQKCTSVMTYPRDAVEEHMKKFDASLCTKYSEMSGGGSSAEGSITKVSSTKETSAEVSSGEEQTTTTKRVRVDPMLFTGSAV